jgi:hypothetical protein
MLGEQQLKYSVSIRHSLSDVLPKRELLQCALNDRALRPYHRQSVRLDLDAR